MTMGGDPNLPAPSVFRLRLGVMSGSASASRRGRPQGVRRGAVLVVALLASAGVVYAGLRDPGPDRSAAAPTPSASPTPLSSLDVSDLPITRGPFCALLETRDVETALGGPVATTNHYDSGDRAPLAPGLTDVAHEYGCGYGAANGARARAWVFAEPVTTATAASLAREAAGGTGCRPVPDSPRFGTPSASTLCRAADPAATVVTLRGLFGDAWLTCQLSTPRTGPAAATASDTTRRAEQWCLRVATTLGARP